LDIGELQFLIKKDFFKILLEVFSSVFSHQNHGFGLDPDPGLYPDPDSLKKLDPDPDKHKQVLLFKVRHS
jgi:hypothetical protein